jgi:hypothetical protein
MMMLSIVMEPELSPVSLLLGRAVEPWMDEASERLAAVLAYYLVETGDL